MCYNNFRRFVPSTKKVTPLGVTFLIDVELCFCARVKSPGDDLTLRRINREDWVQAPPAGFFLTVLTKAQRNSIIDLFHFAGMAELADARDLKSRDARVSYGFDSRFRHQKRRTALLRLRRTGTQRKHAGTRNGYPRAFAFIRALKIRQKNDIINSEGASDAHSRRGGASLIACAEKFVFPCAFYLPSELG